MKQNYVCYQTLGLKNAASLATYKSVGGYDIWRKVLAGEITPEQIITQVKESALRGRGGAGFPTGIKWSFIGRATPGQKYLLCNADESEPGTFKDRDILRYNPHQLIEGICIAAYTIGASVAYNYMRGEFFEPIAAFEQALKEAYADGLLGNNILNSKYDLDLYAHSGAGAYICGEETALMESIEGNKGMPRYKPPFPATYGLYGKPTTINNAETLASIPIILAKGSKWFLELGTEKSGGTKIFSVSGHVQKPGNFEIPLGTPFNVLLDLAGGLFPGRTLKAVIPGGSSAPVLPASVMNDLNMDYDSIAKAGSMLGSAGVIVMDNTTCMVKVLSRVAYFYHHESCGQCTPCREGTGWLYRIVKRILHGEGKLEDIDNLDRVASNIAGRTICALGDAAAMPIRSFVKHFRSEFEAYVAKNG